MNLPKRPLLLSLALILTLSACGGNEAAPTPTTGSSTGQPTTQATAGTSTDPTATTGSAAPTTGTSTGDGASIINVTVTGGPHAGNYRKVSSEPTCSYGLVGPDSWGNQYSNADEKEDLSSLQLIVPSKTEAENGTSNFNVTFTFGELFAEGSTDYKVEGREGSDPAGEGTVTIDGDQNRATVKIEAEPESGVQIEATIECREVFAVQGGPADATPSARVAAAGIDLTIEGGDMPGTYSVVGGVDTCGFGSENPSFLTEGLEEDQKADAWTVEFSNDEEQLNRFLLLIPSTTDAADGTDRFYLDINDQTYYIENLEGQSETSPGTVTVKNSGDTGLVTIDAKGEDGITIKGTVTCHQVTR